MHRRISRGAVLVAAVVGASALASCTGDIGEPPAGLLLSGPGVDASFDPPAASLRRLLGRQYVNSIRDLLGDGAAIAADPPADSSLNGFDAIGSAQLAVNDAAVQQYEVSARGVAAAAIADQPRIDALLGCVPAGPTDAACHARLVENLGRLAWRRPLDQAEIDRYVSVAQGASAELGDFYAGAEYAIATLLQSPNFLYQVEIGEPDPGAGGLRRLTGFEIASRMSFFLLDSTPSAALLDAAAAGDLDDADGVRTAARLLLEKPEARVALGDYYSEVFKLRELDGLVKDGDVFPQFSPVLAQAMREETLRLIEDLVWEREADFLEILDAPYAFVNADLATLYGVDAPADGGFARVDLPEGEGRGGLLGQAAFLSVFAHATTTSPTLRGRFVRETILCQSIPAPPNNVVTDLPPDTEAKTMREKLAAHQVDPSCAGCHVLMDPIGFALENFDGIGAYRTTENGATIDPASGIEGIGEFASPVELGALLREQPEVAACVVRNIFRASTGHVETEGEEIAIEGLVQEFRSSGHRLQDLLVELVASDAFRIVGAAQ